MVGLTFSACHVHTATDPSSRVRAWFRSLPCHFPCRTALWLLIVTRTVSGTYEFHRVNEPIGNVPPHSQTYPDTIRGGVWCGWRQRPPPRLIGPYVLFAQSLINTHGEVNVKDTVGSRCPILVLVPRGRVLVLRGDPREKYLMKRDV